MKASNFLQLSHRWVIKGSSAGASQTDNRAFIFFLNLFEQTYISRYLKKKQKNKKQKNKPKRQFWVEGENLTNQLECLIVNTSANKQLTNQDAW